MRKTVFYLLLLLAFTVGADARLGETLRQCQERYGVMAVEPNPDFPALPGYTFKKNGLKITIRFVGGKGAWISYVSDKPINQEIIDSLLDLNSEESKWIYNETLTEKAASQVAGNDSRYTRKDRGADATYREIGLTSQLVIITRAYHQATNPELEGL